MSKYKNKKVTVDGITFDSIKESRRYQELLLLQRAGKIKDLQRQVKFVLIPTQREQYMDGFKRKPGKVIEREVSYYADFVYTTADGLKVVEDVKSKVTSANQIWVLKRKLMLYVHGIRVKEV